MRTPVTVRTRRTPWPSTAAALALALILYVLPPRRAGGQTQADVKYMHYQEADGRIEVTSPAFLLRYDVSPALTIKVDGVYDTITGATPTGAPATASAAAPVTATTSSAADLSETLFALAGATPPPRKSSSSSSSSASTAAATTNAATAAATDGSIPTAQIRDTRTALNAEATVKHANHVLSGKLSFSTEDDYQSLGASASDGIELNHRATTLTVGAAYTHDRVDVFNPNGTRTRQAADVLAGITQVLGPRTQFTANYVLGHQWGYLDDPYKVAEVDGELIGEQRPDHRTRHTLYLALVQGVPALDAAVEADVRQTLDDFGTDARTVSATWHQHLGPRVVASPTVRYYDQSAADFYAVRFTGSPHHFSADYRLSELTTWSYGLKLAWFVTDRLSVDVAADRYEMDGQDGVTPDDCYVTADAYSVGARWLF